MYIPYQQSFALFSLVIIYGNGLAGKISCNDWAARGEDDGLASEGYGLVPGALGVVVNGTPDDPRTPLARDRDEAGRTG